MIRIVLKLESESCLNWNPNLEFKIPKGLETLNLSLLKAWKIDLKNLHIEWELGC